MLVKSFQDLQRGLLKKELMSFTRDRLRSLMIRATGKRRHSETKDDMAEFILQYTSVPTVRRILGTTTK